MMAEHIWIYLPILLTFIDAYKLSMTVDKLLFVSLVIVVPFVFFLFLVSVSGLILIL